jgi:hypothetical protein
MTSTGGEHLTGDPAVARRNHGRRPSIDDASPRHRAAVRCARIPMRCSRRLAPLS